MNYNNEEERETKLEESRSELCEIIKDLDRQIQEIELKQTESDNKLKVLKKAREEQALKDSDKELDELEAELAKLDKDRKAREARETELIKKIKEHKAKADAINNLMKIFNSLSNKINR